MIAKNLQTVQNSQAEADNVKPSRLFFIDHMRTFLIILVVLHHVALVYGASLNGYYYVEPPFTNPLAFLVLLVFTLVNQGWFMGAFFMLAGYFTPASFDRKGSGVWLKDRLVRLGIPLVVFYFVLSPVSFIGYFLMPPELTGISTPLTWQIFWQAYPDFLNIGPMWFVVLLLIFSFGYAGWRLLKGNRNSSSVSESTTPGYVATGIFIVLLAGASYLFRMVIPLGKIVLQFPSLAYLPQYLSFFIIGAIASRRNWFRTISVSKGVIGFVAALAAGVLLFPLAFSGHWFSLTISSALDNAMGNGHWQSAVYALWDSVFAVGLTMGFITLFRRFINGKGKFGRLLSSQNYAVYVIHIPIVVFIAYALRGLALGSLLKFGVVSLTVVPVCYIAAFLIRRISPVRRVL